MNKYCYAIMTPRGTLLVEDGKLPIYRNKKVAKERVIMFKDHYLKRINLKHLFKFINTHPH